MPDGETNIFGEDVSGHLDVSDEALEARMEPVDEGGDAVEETVESVEQEDDGQVVTEEEEVVTDTEPDEGEVQQEDPAELEAEIPAEFDGKTPAELVAMIQDSQSQVGKQANEVGDLRSQVEEMRKLMEQPKPQSNILSTSDVVDAIVDDTSAKQAFNYAVELVSRGQADEAVIEEVIEATGDVDPGLSRQMDRLLTEHRVRTEMESRIKPVEQVNERTMLQSAVSEMYTDATLGADFKAYEQDVAKILQGRDMPKSQSAIKEVLNQALTYAKGQDPTRSAVFISAQQASKTDQRTQSPNATKVPALNEHDEMRQEIFTQNKAENPLFANFGG